MCWELNEDPKGNLGYLAYQEIKVFLEILAFLDQKVWMEGLVCWVEKEDVGNQVFQALMDYEDHQGPEVHLASKENQVRWEKSAFRDHQGFLEPKAQEVMLVPQDPLA